MKHWVLGMMAVSLALAGGANEVGAALRDTRHPRVRSWKAFRGGWSSGGGNAIVCFDAPEVTARVRQTRKLGPGDAERVTSIESVDLAEASLRRGWNARQPEIARIGEDEAYLSYIGRIEARFAFSVPTLSDLIVRGVAAFPDDLILYSPDPVPFVDDANLAVRLDETRCTLLTVMRQMTTESTNLLWVDLGLFEHPKHSRLSRAVLFLHELVYREARQRGQRDSHNTRLLVGRMINQNGLVTVDEMIRFARNLGFIEGSLRDTYYFRLLSEFGFDQLRNGAVMLGSHEAVGDDERKPMAEALGRALGRDSVNDEDLAQWVEFLDPWTDWSRTWPGADADGIAGVRSSYSEYVTKRANWISKFLVNRWLWPVCEAGSAHLPMGLAIQLCQDAEDIQKRVVSASTKQVGSVTGRLNYSAMTLLEVAGLTLELKFPDRYVKWFAEVPSANIKGFGSGALACKVPSEIGLVLDRECVMGLDRLQIGAELKDEDILARHFGYLLPRALDPGV